MKKTIIVKGIAFIKDPKITALMQASDVFESFKVIAEIVELQYNMSYEKEVSISAEELPKYFQAGLDLAKEEFGDNLVMCNITQIEQDDVIVKNNKKLLPIIDPTVSVVSNGEKWELLVNAVKEFCPGIIIEEGETRKIKSVRYE